MGEFRQHEGVMTMMMFYCRRASPKHCYNIIEEDYGGGGHRTRLRDQEINCCVYGVPPPPYIKGGGGEGRPGRGGSPRGGVLLPPGVGLLLSLLEWEKGREKEKEGRGRPPP